MCNYRHKDKLRSETVGTKIGGQLRLALDDLERMMGEREKVLDKWEGRLLKSVMDRLTNQEKALCLGD